MAPRIGVYDSGIGGLTTLALLQAKLPSCTYVYLADTARMPFGSKSRAEIYEAAENAMKILRAGADKISVNSAAVKNPDLVGAAAEKYGSQCVVVAIDGRHTGKTPSGFEVYVAGGRTPTGIDAVAWAKEVYERGAGEILLTSMDKDGTKSGFDLELTKAVVDVVGIPVIASGGCGSLEHFSEVFEQTGCDAALAASLFHYGELTVGQVKAHLREKNIPVRL